MTMKSMITVAGVLAAAASPALAGERAVAKRNFYAQSIGGLNGAPVDSMVGLSGYPTDYLTNRFGDRQLQGR